MTSWSTCWNLHRPAVLEVVREQRQNLHNPQPTAEELLQRYSAQGLTKSVEILAEYVTLL